MTPNEMALWRSSELGHLTETRELDIIFGILGDIRGHRLLDVGCGDGSYVLEASHRGARATGVDRSEPMLLAARQRCVERGVQVDLQRADALSLPFADASFDIVLAVTLLCFVDAQRAVREMARVVVPGGRVIVADLGAYSLWAWRRTIRGWRGDPRWQGVCFQTPLRLRAVAREAGLVDARVHCGVYWPPSARLARVIAPYDARLRWLFACGAAFLVLEAAREAP